MWLTSALREAPTLHVIHMPSRRGLLECVAPGCKFASQTSLAMQVLLRQAERIGPSAAKILGNSVVPSTSLGPGNRPETLNTSSVNQRVPRAPPSTYVVLPGYTVLNRSSSQPPCATVVRHDIARLVPNRQPRPTAPFNHSNGSADNLAACTRHGHHRRHVTSNLVHGFGGPRFPSPDAPLGLERTPSPRTPATRTSKSPPYYYVRSMYCADLCTWRRACGMCGDRKARNGAFLRQDPCLRTCMRRDM